MTGRQLIHLQAELAGGGWCQVDVNPTHGARIERYITRDSEGVERNWLVPVEKKQGGCFVMVPFCSRIKNNQFEFGGHSVQLRAEMDDGNTVIHGHGHRQVWREYTRSASAIGLGYEYPPSDWPWAYAVEQNIELVGAQLQISIQVRNLSEFQMPAGVGIHPYFPLNNSTELQVQVQALLELDRELMPREVSTLPMDLDLCSGIHPSQLDLDHVFLHREGAVNLHWPESEQRLQMTSSENNCHVVVYSPKGANFVCVEPVSNVPNGFNTRLDGVTGVHQVIAPGGALVASWQLSPEL